MIEWSKTLYERTKKPIIALADSLGITTLQITIFNQALVLLFGCYFFSRGTYWGNILGLGFCIINGYLDYLDGDYARLKKQESELGAWLDGGFDLVIQNAIMAAIAIGCFKNGMGVFWISMFLVGNTASNFVSFNYNSRFGFDSFRGNELFRMAMDESKSRFDKFFKILIDPTSSYIPLVLFTYRYFIAAGSILNILPLCFIIMTILVNFRWIVMFIIYSLYLKRDCDWWVVKVLSVLDEERNEFYELRRSC